MIFCIVMNWIELNWIELNRIDLTANIKCFAFVVNINFAIIVDIVLIAAIGIAIVTMSRVVCRV